MARQRARCSLWALTMGVALGCSAPSTISTDKPNLAQAREALSTQWSVAVPGGASLQNTILSSTNSLKLDDRVTVGDGVTLYAIVNFGTQTTQLAAGVQANGNVSSVASVWLGSSSYVKGFVKTTGTVQMQDGVTVAGGQTTNMTIGQSPTSWVVNVPDSNAGDVYLGTDQSRPLAPGAYGNLNVQSRSTVSLSAGTYYFTSFNTEPQAAINLDESAGPVIIYVTGLLTAKGDWIPSGGSGTNLLVAVLGSSVADFQTAIAGTVLAPNGTVYLERPSNNAPHHGSVFAKDIEVFSDAELQFASVNWNFLCPAGDSDGDGVSDCQDLCPQDSNKIDPGICGCGIADVDTDGDGVPDCQDDCPADPRKTRADVCGGCGQPLTPAGATCTDGICRGQFTCDGTGICGDPEACSPDPGHCVAREAGDSVYWVCQGTVTWSQALGRCSTIPGQSLVEIDSRAENALISQWVTAPAWTGANDQSALGTWRWSSGASTDGTTFFANGNVLTGGYAHWAAGKPSDNTGQCATLQSDGTWSDEACGQTESVYICKGPGPARRLSGPDAVPIDCSQFSPNKDCSATLPADAGPCVSADAGLPSTIDEFTNQLDTCNSANCTQDGDPGCSQCQGAASIPPPGTNNCTAFGSQACPITPTQPPISCSINSDCPSGQVCDWSTTCHLCDERDSAGNCIKVCPPATLLCGTRDPGCGQASDDSQVIRCGETEICPDPTANGNNDYLSDPATNLSPSTIDPAVFGQPSPPIGTYPLDPACDNPPCSHQGMGHPWCTYAVDDTLDTKTLDDSLFHGRGGTGSLIQFDFDPNLNLTFDATPMAFGEMQYNLEAIASLSTGVTFNLPVVGSTGVSILDAAAELESNRCDISTAGSYFKLFGQDFLPTMISDPSGNRDDMLFSVASDDCAKALGDFQVAVDRAKKALRDAQELLRQYYTDMAAGNKLQAHLCPQIASDPPKGFPPGDCANETPEATINRFIGYYEGQVKAATDAQAALDKLHPSVPANSKSFKMPPANLGSPANSESIPVYQTQFFVGPIPMRLEVQIVVNYGISGSTKFQFNPASLTSTGAREKLVYQSGNVTPWSSAAVNLFVGAGFSVDSLEAKAGVEGQVSLGRTSTPISHGTGIDVQAEADPRPLPTDLATYATATPLVPLNQYHFYLDYDYGVQAKVSDILDGFLGAVVKIKIAFFRKSWRKQLVTFPSPIPTQTFDLVSDGSGNAATGFADWGVVRMPVPFVDLQLLTVPTTSDGTVPFDTNQVDKLFYDTLCTCQDLGKSCFRAADCCPFTSGEPPICFGYQSNPTVCSTCRGIGATCNTDDDCCKGAGPAVCRFDTDSGLNICKAQVQVG